MTYIVTASPATVAALAVWAGRPIKTFPALRGQLVVADCVLLATGAGRFNKRGELRSKRAAERLESTVREMALRNGVQPLTKVW